MLYVDSGCCPTFWVFSFLILTKYIDELQNIYIYTKAFVAETKSEGVSSLEKLEIRVYENQNPRMYRDFLNFMYELQF